MAIVATGMIIGGAVSVLGSVVGGIFGASKASKAKAAAEQKQRMLQGELNTLEANRAAIINPYANQKNLSSMAKDLSGMATNTYANLSVATQATKFQAEQADASLANTLDTLRQTGAGAGGATALAMAALASKQGISASLESQEVQNEKLKAQGQQQLQETKMAEAGRLQAFGINEEQRMNTAADQANLFKYNEQEQRSMQKMNRVSSQMGIAQQQQAQAEADYTGAITGAITGVASGVGNMVSGLSSAPKAPTGRF